MIGMKSFFWIAGLLMVGVVFPGQGAAAQSFDFTNQARAILLVETEHGGVLFAKSPALELPIASLTKLMTALVFVQTRPAWERIVTIRSSDVRSGGKRVLGAGDRIRVRDLLTLALMRSDNTAAQSLVRASGMTGEEFIAAMNAKAEEFGIAQTRFVEPTGLSPENRSSARDLVHLAYRAFSHPTIGAILRLPSAFVPVDHAGDASKTWKRRRIFSTNLLLGKRARGFEVLEGKTGTTDEAGYSFIVHARTKAKPRQNLLAVVLAAGSASERFSVALDVLAFGSEKALEFPQEITPVGTALQSAGE